MRYIAVTPSADCNISHIAVGLINYLILRHFVTSLCVLKVMDSDMIYDGPTTLVTN